MRGTTATQAAVTLLFVFSASLSLRYRRSKREGRGNSGAAEPIKNLLTSGRSGRRNRRNIVRKKSIQVVISFAVVWTSRFL